MTQVGCKWMSAHLEEYINGGCTESERESAELHLAICIECETNVKMWSFLTRETPRAQLPPLSPIAERRILSGGREETINGLEPGRVWPKRAALGAMVAAAAAVAVLVMRPGAEVALPDRLVAVAPTDESGSHSAVSCPDEGGDGESALQSVSAVAPEGAVIDVAPGTVLRLSQNANVRVKALDDHQARFQLVSGYVVADIGPVPTGFRFVVETPEREIEARGTVFAVEVEASGSANVRVAEGTVEVRHNTGARRTHIVKEGQSLSSSASAPVLASAEALASDMALVSASGAVAQPVEPAPLAVPTVAPGAADSRGKLQPEPPDEQGPTQLLELAQAFRRSGAYKPAAATYEQVITAYPSTTSAAISLVSLGQLHLTALREPEKALSFFDRYLSAMPHGNLWGAALSGRVRALAKLARHQEVIESVSLYLQAHPSSRTIPEMYRRLGEARISLGNCADGVRDLNHVIETWPSSSEAQRARNALTRCGTGH